MRPVVTKEAPPPCFACCATELLIAARWIVTTLAQYHGQSLGVVGQSLGGAIPRLIAARRKGKHGHECREETLCRAADKKARGHVRTRRS
jgi:hypothetical protein